MSKSTMTEERRVCRVLMVDDERALGITLARALGETCEMICETSAQDALRRLEHDRDYDVILCDVNMPGCSGMALYECLARRWPGLERRVVFITGGVCDDGISSFLSRIPNSCLEKPFELSTLERILPRACAASG
jgi:two-component system, cell cycle sensor histidine kinase and response regulator CckA